MRKAHVLPAVLICFLASSTAQTSSLLDRLAGEWRGTGLYTEVAGGSPERVACRLETDVTADGSRANASGRCSTAGGAARFRIVIDRSPNMGFAATFASSAAPEATAYRGRASGQSLVFESIAPLAIKNRRYRSRIVIRFKGGDSFGMFQTLSPVTGGARLTIADVGFSRRAAP